jgi:hypothetical protein
LTTILNIPFGPKSRATISRLVRFSLGRQSGQDQPEEQTEDPLTELLMHPPSTKDDDFALWLDRGKDKPSTLRDFIRFPLLITLGWSCFAAKLTLFFLTALLFGPGIALLWRARRRLADATAVQLTRNPDGLARALRRLASETGEIGGARSIALLFIVWPKPTDRQSLLGSFGLVPFHPPIEKRLRRMKALGAPIELEPARPRIRVLGSANSWWGILAIGAVLMLLPILVVLIAVMIVMVVGLDLMFMTILLLVIDAMFQLIHLIHFTRH